MIILPVERVVLRWVDDGCHFESVDEFRMRESEETKVTGDEQVN